MLFLIFGSMDFGVENIVQLSALLIAWKAIHKSTNLTKYNAAIGLI